MFDNRGMYMKIQEHQGASESGYSCHWLGSFKILLFPLVKGEDSAGLNTLPLEDLFFKAEYKMIGMIGIDSLHRNISNGILVEYLFHRYL